MLWEEKKSLGTRSYLLHFKAAISKFDIAWTKKSWKATSINISVVLGSLTIKFHYLSETLFSWCDFSLPQQESLFLFLFSTWTRRRVFSDRFSRKCMMKINMFLTLFQFSPKAISPYSFGYQDLWSLSRVKSQIPQIKRIYLTPQAWSKQLRTGFKPTTKKT